MTGRLKVYDADTGLWQYVDGAGAQANLMRYVPLPAHFDASPAATTATLGYTNSRVLSELPTTAVAVSMTMSAGSSVINNSMRFYIFGYGNGSNIIALAMPGKVAGHYEGMSPAYVPLGGDRQFGYGYNVAIAGTITASVQITGYWVIDVSTAIASGGGSIIGVGGAFPGAPLVNDRFFRTDLKLEFFWDGTRWLTTTLYTAPIAMQGAGGFDPVTTTSNHRTGVPHPTLSFYVEQFWATTYVQAPNSGSAYWTVACFGATLSTAGQAATAVTTLIATVNQVNSAVGGWIQSQETKVGAPGGLYANPMFSYRLIGP